VLFFDKKEEKKKAKSKTNNTLGQMYGGTGALRKKGSLELWATEKSTEKEELLILYLPG